MSNNNAISDTIFSINSDNDFSSLSLEIFAIQYREVAIYREFCELLGKRPDNVRTLTDIPFLPIEFFKSHTVVREVGNVERIFESSGTSGVHTSKHHVSDLKVYHQSLLQSFRKFVADPAEIHLFALLPTYAERNNSSLVYMVHELMKYNFQQRGDFYLHNYTRLIEDIEKTRGDGKQIVLIGVSFALMELANNHATDLSDVIIIETGGMKGKLPEVTREELHSIISKGLSPKKIMSEYGMTELLSQAYAGENGIFRSPSWLRALIRDVNDPFSFQTQKTGGLNIIDLANFNSCSFIATSDLGKLHGKNEFEILGRIDNSDLRGCNLLYDLA